MLTPNIFLKGRPAIYGLRNLLNNKIYVGKTRDMYFRCYQYTYDFREKRKDHINEYLFRSMEKNGIENFEMFPLEFCSIDDLSERELFWMDELRSCENERGYNLRRDSSSGMETHQNTSDKISARLKEEWASGVRDGHADKLKAAWDRRGPEGRAEQGRRFSRMKTKWEYTVDGGEPILYADLNRMGLAYAAMTKFSKLKVDTVVAKGHTITRRVPHG